MPGAGSADALAAIRITARPIVPTFSFVTTKSLDYCAPPPVKWTRGMEEHCLPKAAHHDSVGSVAGLATSNQGEEEPPPPGVPGVTGEETSDSGGQANGPSKSPTVPSSR